MNQKQATAEFCMCAPLNACMEARTCLGVLQRAIWRRWYDPVQRIMVKSVLIDLDIHRKVGFSKSSNKLKTTELQD